uniref:ATP-dependent RNA helicase n=1 Tax=Oryza rufipogon TaxID=4529 RepID=A0A0E0MZB9_ORYRU
MAAGDLLLRTQSGLPVLARAFPSCLCLRVPARRRRGAPPLTAAKVDVADAVGRRVRSGGAAVPKRRRSRRDAEEEEEEGLAFSRVVTGRGRGVREEGVAEGEAPEFDAAKSGDESGGVDGSYLSDTRFDQCTISPLSLKAVKDAGYERMTQVQEATLPVILQGKDVLAKAKTGTGKTVAFLLPAIEVLSALPNSRRDQLRPSINLLVMCPTRELAIQVAVEAKKLLKYHRSLGVQVVIGGTRLTQEQRSMQANPCQILVATPGRLKDHVENTPGFSTRLKGVKVLVLDEADRLLDMGFRRDIERIIASVPKERQTLLFSATVPEEVRQISHIAMKKNYKFINTVKDGDEETHAQVSQMFMIAPLDLHFSILYDVLKKHVAEDADYKVIIFCTTAMVTKLVAEILSQLRLNIREIHSRKSQSARTKVSDEFRKSRGLILVSSDVSARGVDYPDVTLVIQVGVPADRQQYIHRLGRTGRKGKEGQGLLLLAPWEKYFLSSIKDLSISEATVPSVDSSTQTIVKDAVRKVEMRSKECAYQAWLGYYNSNKTIGREKSRLVKLAEEFSQSMELSVPPAIPKQILRKMGLNNRVFRPFATAAAAAAARAAVDAADEIEIVRRGEMMSGGPSDATHRKRRRRRGPKGSGVDGPSIPRAVTTNGAGPEEEEVVEGKAMELDAGMSAAEVGGVVGSHLSETRFDQCPVSPLSLKAIKDAGYEKMTQVQEATLPIILQGEDVLAKAKTGTGKTVAFLLANQVAAEARKLLKYHRSLGVQVVIGGTKLPQEQRSMQSNPCQILVATPGRLKDHLENTPGFSNRIKGVKVLVLDEADRLLDMGFRRDIEKIIAFIPKERQTLLFSATVPEEVRQISHVAMKRGYKFINTVKEGDEETHSQVSQMYMVAPLDLHFSILYNVLKKHIAEDADYKVIVFCTTAMVTKLVAEVLSQLKLNIREIHSRKSQSARTKVSDEFRKSKGLILVSSDVSARGVDYPDVTLVIQVGLPADREQYIHRLGRTGRKGKDGLGLLLLAPWETYFLNSVQDLSVSQAVVPTIDSSIQTGVKDALGRVETKSKESAYQAWLGYYNSNKAISRDKSRLVRLAEEFSQSMGLAIPPAIPKLILRKMGLNNVPGLRSV